MSIDKFFFSLFWAHTKYPLILRTGKLAENRQKKWRIFQCQELSWHKRMSMLWFNFILRSNVIFLCFKLVIIHYNTQKQKKTKFEPRIKSNHNIYINHLAAWKNLQFYLNCPTSPTSFDVFVNQTDFTIAVTWIQLKNLAAIIKVWFYMTWWGIENKGKNIIWWSLALLSFSWDRSLLVTKSWYSRSCFSGMIQGGRMSGVQIPLHQIWQIFERKLLEMWDHILLLNKYIHLAWIIPLLIYVRVQHKEK